MERSNKAMDEKEIKKLLIEHIGGAIDEDSLSGFDSFMEMDRGVIHCEAGGKSWYFKVTLTAIAEDEYFKPYEP